MATLAARSQRLAHIESRLELVRAEVARKLWEYGYLLLEVQRDELWRDAGHGSFWGWVDAVERSPHATVTRAITVAQHFTGEECARWGAQKLDSTVRYLEVTKAVEKPGDLHGLSFRVRDERGAFRSVPFEKAGYRTIDRARQELLAARQPGPDEEVTALVAHLSPAANAGLAVKRRKDGKLALTLSDVALDELPAVIADLQARLAAWRGAR